LGPDFNLGEGGDAELLDDILAKFAQQLVAKVDVIERFAGGVETIFRVPEAIVLIRHMLRRVLEIDEEPIDHAPDGARRFKGQRVVGIQHLVINARRLCRNSHGVKPPV
jgi:hypothetical protein